MQMLRAQKVTERDIKDFSWRSLRNFHNVKYTTERIIKAHNLEKEHFKNAEKIANQIRFFLLQSKEYFDASASVTLVTKPVLLYYSVMCLATVEILFKQGGDVSLDRARENHRHHGLIFNNTNSKSDKDLSLSITGSRLIAQPATRIVGTGQSQVKERFGTFELWHRSSRPYPVPGESTVIDSASRGTTSGYEIVANSKDERMSLGNYPPPLTPAA